MDNDNINKEEHYQYCKLCGFVYVQKDHPYCWNCGSFDTPITSKYPISYYELNTNQSLNNDPLELLYAEEISKQPGFDICKKNLRLPEHGSFREKRIDEQNRAIWGDNWKEQFKPVEPPSPECPTCHSKNVRKISVAKRAVFAGTFGLFSKTARSQFECKDCGYKW